MRAESACRAPADHRRAVGDGTEASRLDRRHAQGTRRPFSHWPAVVSVRHATGLRNPSVLNALARKGLLLAGRSGLPVLTAEGLAYNTGIAAEILHGDDH
jgi:hypothetical protein